jgi:hypothetical protein
MSDYLGPQDAPSRIEKFLDEMKAIVREVLTEQTRLKDDMVRLKADNADHAALRRVQDEMRQYVDTKTEHGIDRGVKALEDKVGLARSSILTETEKMIVTRLNDWADERLQPMLDEILLNREKQAEKDREMRWQKVKNRITTITSVIALITAVVLFVMSLQNEGQPSDTKHLDRLNSVGDAALSIQ